MLFCYLVSILFCLRLKLSADCSLYLPLYRAVTLFFPPLCRLAHHFSTHIYIYNYIYSVMEKTLMSENMSVASLLSSLHDVLCDFACFACYTALCVITTNISHAFFAPIFSTLKLEVIFIMAIFCSERLDHSCWLH